MGLFHRLLFDLPRILWTVSLVCAYGFGVVSKVRIPIILAGLPVVPELVF